MSTTVRTSPGTRRLAPGWPARVGGLLAISVSGVLLASVVFRHLTNALNLWTILLGAIAGVLALQKRPTRLGLTLCEIFLVAAALPALIAGVGFLYIPSIVLILAEIFLDTRSAARA